MPIPSHKAHAKKIEHYRRTKALGRLSAADTRDKQHHMSAVLPRRAPAIASKSWVPGQILDQGDRPACVGYSWTGFLLASPTRTKILELTGGLSYPVGLYSAAQQVDEWPGDDYEGTSVRAGAKALTNQNRLSEYVWAWDADTLRRFILSRGPAVIGINWYEKMFATTERGYLIVDGELAGGHAILVIGYSERRKAFRLLNSWGANWGQHGRAWVKLADMERLISEDGEACSATEVTPAKVTA